MKTFLKRFSYVLIAIMLGSGVFIFFLKAGTRSKGPLADLFSSISAAVAQGEKRLIDIRESRSSSLEWFNQYRNNRESINHTNKLLLGAYDDQTIDSYENIITLEDSLKTKLPIISIYSAWGSKKDQAFPLLRVQAIYDLGSIPMITWEPWLNDFDAEKFAFNAAAVNKNKGGMKAIAEGRYDAYIDKWAIDAVRFGLPFYVRYGHEMNDPYRYPWGQQNNSPEDYIKAWRHIVNRFRAKGATNAIWIWSPHPAYATYKQFYPGPTYVDWIGITALNYGTVATWSQWWSFDDVVKKAYTDLSLYKKPVMLTEFGCLAVGGNRADWFTKALTDLPKKYPGVKAVVFFHASHDNTTTYKALDWSFETDKKVLESVRRGIQNW